MKKLIIYLALFLGLIVPEYMKALELPVNFKGFYVSSNVSCNLVSHTRHRGVKFHFEPGLFISPAIGYRFCNGLRLEGEFGYRYNHLCRLNYCGTNYHVCGHLETFSGLANIYYDFPVCWYIKPYVGAGLGYAHVNHRLHIGNLCNKECDDGFAWQVMAGLTYSICSNMDLSAEYRFFRNENFNHLQNHAIGGSLRYYF